MTNIISIQSTVLNDLVGNQAARYMLSSKQYNFYEIPTIVLTSTLLRYDQQFDEFVIGNACP